MIAVLCKTGVWKCLMLFLFPDVQETADLPEGASTPALGLSNKAVFQGLTCLSSVLILSVSRSFLTFPSLVAGDLASQSPQRDADGFDSLSDQYKESYFQPVKLTGIYVHAFNRVCLTIHLGTSLCATGLIQIISNLRNGNGSSSYFYKRQSLTLNVLWFIRVSGT